MEKISRNSDSKSKHKRMYYIDWLRSSDVHVVVLLHCIFTTDKVTNHSLHNHVWKEKMEHFFRYLVQIGIPLFFLLSGMGSIYFETEKKGFLQFVKNRFQRLIYPFIFAVLVFLVPRLYLSQGWETIGRLDKNSKIEWNFFKYYPLILMDGIIMRLGQLWFLPVMMLICLFNYPLLAWSRRRIKRTPYDREDVKLVLG